MTTSEAGIRMIEGFEGLRLKAYDDGTGVWTIGYGTTAGVREGDTCTEFQAEEWLRIDLANAERCVNSRVMGTLAQCQFDALVSFVFNLGCGRFGDLLPFLNSGQYQKAADKMLKYDHAGGEKMAGLTRRRAAEVNMFLGEA